jgi:hypothetical protein
MASTGDADLDYQGAKKVLASLSKEFRNATSPGDGGFTLAPPAKPFAFQALAPTQASQPSQAIQPAGQPASQRRTLNPAFYSDFDDVIVGGTSAAGSLSDTRATATASAESGENRQQRAAQRWPVNPNLVDLEWTVDPSIGPSIMRDRARAREEEIAALAAPQPRPPSASAELTRQSSRYNEIRDFLLTNTSASKERVDTYARKLVDDGYDTIYLLLDMSDDELKDAGFMPVHAAQIVTLREDGGELGASPQS